MTWKTDPIHSLALINKAIESGIKHLHQIQGSRRKGSLHLMVTNRHKKGCHGCPHYGWRVWVMPIAQKGPGIGKPVPIAAEVKAPTRTNAAKSNPKVMEMILILTKLLEQRASLIDSISRAERSALATVKGLRQFAA